MKTPIQTLTQARGSLNKNESFGQAPRIFCALIVLFALAGLARVESATVNPIDWVTGDVVVAAGNGYQIWHSANPAAANPVYTPLQTINDGLGGTTAGCAFDSAYRLFGTNLTNTKVDQYSIDFSHGVARQIGTGGGSPASSHPESIVFDGKGNFFVGHVDSGTGFGNGAIEKWSLDTNKLNPTFGTYQLVATFAVPVESRGAGWIDLSADASTIYYTSEGRKILKYNVVTQQASVFFDLGNPGAPNYQLSAIRILPDGNVLVADKKNIKLVSTTGVVRTYDASGQDNWVGLTLDPNTTSFWAGDATSHNFYRFNILSGAIEVGPLNAGAGINGICVDGGFSAAQKAAMLTNVQTFTPDPNTPGSNTILFTSSFTGARLTATLANLTQPVTVTVRNSLVDPAFAQSDPTVFSFNVGNPDAGTSTFPGNMPCDQTLTDNSPYPDTCEVFTLEAEPNSGFSITNLLIDKPAFLDEHTPNLRLIRNLDEDITTGVIDYPTSGTATKKCVYTVNQQTSNPAFEICGGGFSSPAKGTNFDKNKTASIAFKFKVAQAGACPSGSSPTNSRPLLLIVQTFPADPNTGIAPAPAPVDVIVAGKSGGPPTFVLSGGTWQLQVKTTNMPAGFTYIATMIDLNAVVPSISTTFTLK